MFRLYHLINTKKTPYMKRHERERRQIFNGRRIDEHDGRAVPVFNDKHLSFSFAKAKEMVQTSQRLNFPFLAGSSLPVTWRLPAVELPMGCAIDAKQAMFDLFGPIIWETYGGTEGLATVASPDEWLARPGTVGRAVAAMGTDVVILDERGEPLPAGEAGLVYVSTPPQGRFHYHQAPDATAAAWRGSWFTLGDVGYLDADGFLFLVDRSKDMIITGGENVYPAETERVLAAHPAVSQAAVIGVPDPEWGESVLAVVVATAPVTGDELIAHCRARLASHKCPRAVDLVPELPLDPLGKVRKRELRNRYLS